MGVHATLAQTAALRRVCVEDYTLAAGDLKRCMEATGQDPPRKLPAAERGGRYNASSAAYSGLVFEGQLECPHALVGKAA